ncbi:EbsA family protein [Streptococcus pluranimalium]|uniref:EbsA family protein n=1 Tax=Streptococcus pluranimalium TaxID=82348 RepID=UPI0039FCCC66
MITIFGKVRYHWQPELSWLLIYWSLTIAPIFIGLALLFERRNVSFAFFFLFALFLILLGVGLHRFFIIGQGDQLKIVSMDVFKPQSVPISSISKIEVNKLSITLLFGDTTKKRRFYMRKWPKKYFLDALAVNPYFQGEVELMDNFIELDYFEAYKDNQATKVSKL